MKDCSRRNDIVLDPFVGSGTTVLAAERTGRRAYAMEIDPHYCDVTVRRWQTLHRQDRLSWPVLAGRSKSARSRLKSNTATSRTEGCPMSRKPRDSKTFALQNRAPAPEPQRHVCSIGLRGRIQSATQAYAVRQGRLRQFRRQAEGVQEPEDDNKRFTPPRRSSCARATERAAFPSFRPSS